ncbi:hypothetical protein A5774_09060 [Corynebacterium sp. EPI-003-04-2554_SCH2473622]|nr:hypothetical protein A5774_09060 [Corynebacterium sp. EPI-003-04-2554_SCH2473622]
MVIFGVTGDLAYKKLLPAIYDLANRGLLSSAFILVGFGRRDWSNQDFVDYVKKAVQDGARTPFRENVWRQLASGMEFVIGGFDDDGFDCLAERISEVDEQRGLFVVPERLFNDDTAPCPWLRIHHVCALELVTYLGEKTRWNG